MGRRRSPPRWPRPSWRTGSGPARTTGCGSPAPDGAALEIDTTRPELLPACVALVCHPTTSGTRDLVGSTPARPLFGVEVPVYAHPLADPAKGTGIAMVCTFGDLTDVTWWRDLQLDTRVVIGRDGRLLAEPPSGVDATAVRRAGRPDRSSGAGPESWSCCASAGDLIGEPRPITHPVKFYEKGDLPLEIVEHPPVVPAQRRPRRRPARGAAGPAGSCAGCRTTCDTGTSTGSAG